MILADTSAWVEYDRATGSAVDRRLTDLIAEGGPLAVTEPVVMEVLAGASSDTRENDLRRLLLRFELAAVDPTADFEAAARIYRCAGVPASHLEVSSTASSPPWHGGAVPPCWLRTSTSTVLLR